jgi:hypothetical protein
VYHTKRVGVQASMSGEGEGEGERERERERGNTYICNGGREDASNDTRF